jgi:mRNA interferase RelE/StbE
MTPLYEVYLEHAAEKDLKKLSQQAFSRVITQIKKLRENPRPTGCRKITGSKHDWRIRVGNYRIIYEVDDNALAVRIMRIRYRREAYR